MSAQRIVLYIANGAVIWFVAAIILNRLGGSLFQGAAVHIGVFAATLLLSPVLIWSLAKLTGARTNKMFAPAAIVVTTALLLDGAAISWAPGLYGGTGPALALNAAWLLWAVGCVLASAMVMQARSR